MSIKEIRSELKLTQEQFAELLGVSTRSIQNWEQGRIKTPLAIQRLAESIYGTARDKQ